MGYPPRVCFDGALYHVTTRGDNREPVFLDATDYQHFLRLLGRYKERFRFTLHAYALMPNHIHLIVEPAAGTTVSRIMQCLTITYTKWFNRRHGRVGHVFQGRFHSRLIEQDAYLLVASRYVHLNPVRARLVRRPADYAWSSYRAYQQSLGDPLCLVDTATLLSLVDPGTREPQRAYQEFVEKAWRREAEGEGWGQKTILGSPAFEQAIRVQFALVSRPRGRPKKKMVSDTIF